MTELERFEQLMAIHGSDIDRWPTDEQLPARQLLSESVAAQSLHNDQQTLDTMLDAIPVPPMAAMQRRIVRNLAAATRSSLLDRVLEWIVPRGGNVSSWAWRPALVACLPLMCGIYMANFYSFGIESTENSWQEELYLISMNDYAEISE